MIDYETFAKIHDCHDRQGLTIAQREPYLVGVGAVTRHAVGGELGLMGTSKNSFPAGLIAANQIQGFDVI